MLKMKRREFIALVGGGGLLLSANMSRARAQQPLDSFRTEARERLVLGARPELF